MGNGLELYVIKLSCHHPRKKETRVALTLSISCRFVLSVVAPWCIGVVIDTLCFNKLNKLKARVLKVLWVVVVV